MNIFKNKLLISKNTKYFSVILILSFLFGALLIGREKEVTSAVTYTFSPGRFGDHLLAYIHAKWVSYIYGIPLLYKPFSYSDQLLMHEKEKFYSVSDEKIYTHKLVFTKKDKLENFSINPYSNTLYVIPYFPESFADIENPILRSWGFDFPYFKVDWQNKNFIDFMRKLIQPRHVLQKVAFPSDCFVIGVHIRKNSNGFDRPLSSDAVTFDSKVLYSDQIYPLKFPPEAYYIEQIRYVLKMYGNKRVYIHIFTDDCNPSKIVNKLQEIIKDERVAWGYRAFNNNHVSHILEDFFSMMNVDCLIRPDSNLSLIASKLGSFSLVISPKHHVWRDNRLIIDQVERSRNDFNEL